MNSPQAREMLQPHVGTDGYYLLRPSADAKGGVLCTICVTYVVDLLSLCSLHTVLLQFGSCIVICHMSCKCIIASNVALWLIIPHPHTLHTHLLMYTLTHPHRNRSKLMNYRLVYDKGSNRYYIYPHTSFPAIHLLLSHYQTQPINAEANTRLLYPVGALRQDSPTSEGEDAYVVMERREFLITEHCFHAFVHLRNLNLWLIVY